MRVVAEIFSQGEEVVCGQTVDSNAAWLSQNLVELGFVVKRHTAVGDDLDDLVTLVREIAGRADCCICTGGLGPTTDDLTAEAVGIAAGRPLQFDEAAMRQIETYFANRQRPMPAANRKQACFPRDSLRIDNPVGTAPGFTLKIERCWFVFLPGVPSEMKAMFADIRRQLLQRFTLRPDCLVTLRSVGIGESAIQQCLEELQLPDGVQLGFRAAVEEVQTKLLFPAGFSEVDKLQCVGAAAALIGDYVFAIDGMAGVEGGDLLSVIDRGMVLNKHRLAVLETASGGLLAAKCLGREWLDATFVNQTVAQASLQWHLEVNADDPKQTAEDLAAQLLRRQSADLALVQLCQGSISNYQSKDKTIVVYNCLKTPTGVSSNQLTLGGGAQTKQTQAALLTLDLLRRYLQNPCL